MTNPDLVYLAGSRPLSEKSERTLAHWNDPQVRLAWARAGNHNATILQERMGSETDPQVLTELGRHGAHLHPAFAQRLWEHEDIEVALTAALDTACPDARTAATLRRLRGRNKHKLSLFLSQARLKDLSGKELSLAEIIRHAELDQVRSVLPLATGETSQKALLYRLQSLSENHPRRDSFIRAGRLLAWKEDLHSRFVAIMGRWPERFASELAHEAALQAEQRRKENQLRSVPEWSETPEGQAQILLALHSADRIPTNILRQGAQTHHYQAMASLALQHGTWNVADTLRLLAIVRPDQRTEGYLRLADGDLTREETGLLLTHVSAHDQVVTTTRVLAKLPTADVAEAVTGFPGVGRNYYRKHICVQGSAPLLRALWERETSPQDRTLLAGLILERSEGAIPLEILDELPGRQVHASKHGRGVFREVLETLPEGAFEVYVALSESNESIKDIRDAARNTSL